MARRAALAEDLSAAQRHERQLSETLDWLAGIRRLLAARQAGPLPDSEAEVLPLLILLLLLLLLLLLILILILKLVPQLRVTAPRGGRAGCRETQ